MPANSSLFWDIWKKAEQQSMTVTREKFSRDWFRNEARNISVPSDVRQLLKPEKDWKRRALYPGRVYMFEYDALTKDKLPYWDMFPLVIPFNMAPNTKTGPGFMGYNLHYLNRPMRARLFDSLYPYVTNEKYNDNQRFDPSSIVYERLNGVKGHRWFEPTIHTYLFSQIRSPIYKIPAQYWDLALFLNTERFQKKSKTYVWKESAKKIRDRWSNH